MATSASESLSPAREAVARLTTSRLRGRGGSWFPTARKWRAVLAEGGSPALVCNGAEGEPGSIKDRYLMRRHPAEVLAGVARAAALLGVPDPVVYLKGAFLREEAGLRAALPPGASIAIRRGADTYVGGEETAVLEALEDRRAWPRPKPPLPAAVGLHGRPTLVQNVETLWRLPAALDDPAAYRGGRDDARLVVGPRAAAGRVRRAARHAARPRDRGARRGRARRRRHDLPRGPLGGAARTRPGRHGRSTRMRCARRDRRSAPPRCW